MNQNQPETEMPIPLARLDLYNEAIIMTKFGQNSSTSYPVSIHDLAAAFGKLPKSSGFLPRNTLFHGRNQGQEFVGIYLDAGSHTVTVDEATITIPLPPTIPQGDARRSLCWLRETVLHPRCKRLSQITKSATVLLPKPKCVGKWDHLRRGHAISYL